jgi:dipeptidyl aminopeptidase/acylaminoacyl peptidase
MELPHGEPKLVTDHQHPVGHCWTADSREIVFSTSSDLGEVGLWRILADGGEPRAVPTRGEKIGQPTIAGHRLAYVSGTFNSDIWRQELTERETMHLPLKPLFSWSSVEEDPRISPDGSRIAFMSNGSGSEEIWISNADGTGPIKLTDKAAAQGSPCWSPDGKNIAFDSIKSGNLDIYLVSAEGGPAHRITTDPSEEAIPNFSRDGRWIYFGSNRNGSWQIWKMPSDGGQAIQITRIGGASARESRDGFVYYVGYYDLQKRGIWRVPVSGGPETLVLDRQLSPAWDLTDRGIYFIDRTTKPVATICFYDFATRLVKNLTSVNRETGFVVSSGISVSRDDNWLLYTGGISTSDIMMIDNFR